MPRTYWSAGSRTAWPNALGESDHELLVDVNLDSYRGALREAELVDEVGRGSVRSRMVADWAGVSPCVVHYPFSSADLLEEAALRYARAALTQALKELLEYEEVAEESSASYASSGATPDPIRPRCCSPRRSLLAAVWKPSLRADLLTLLDGFRDGMTDWLRAR